jgi:hypothetical protein
MQAIFRSIISDQGEKRLWGWRDLNVLKHGYGIDVVYDALYDINTLILTHLNASKKQRQNAEMGSKWAYTGALVSEVLAKNLFFVLRENRIMHHKKKAAQHHAEQPVSLRIHSFARHPVSGSLCRY